ncbi:MAG: ADP-glyceromanno-heptose 6-epimerase [Bacteroidetes bacterium]|nr:ADP-glyceromanno-heptose 6-epimerase [Bacteroidota bacterium]
MSNQLTIVVTGTAGFIGSVMVQYLNEQGFTQLILVDDFGVEAKRNNWEKKQFIKVIERQAFLEQLDTLDFSIDVILHLGARTDTTEFNYAIHEELNVTYSKTLWTFATEKQIPFIYASSAATYGAGENGYEDSHTILDQLVPLNPYGVSKNEFDKWAIAQKATPPSWAGLKFFNVYGPNESHKGRMASVIFHAFNQIKETGLVKLFKSHRSDFNDGEQLRDFIFVKDVVRVIFWMMQKMQSNDWSIQLNGLHNLGTGKARSFYDLAANTFTAQGLKPNIEFIDMPLDIRDKYQYFTEANMNKLRAAGYNQPFASLEEGVGDYVKNYLLPAKGY